MEASLPVIRFGKIVYPFRKKVKSFCGSACETTCEISVLIRPRPAKWRALHHIFFLMVLMAPFSSLDTWAWEIPTSAETSIWVFPS